jgi:hypothetical protein
MGIDLILIISPLDLLISLYSTFAGAFVFIMQTNKAKRKALEVTFREHCLKAEEVTSLKNKESEDSTS